MTITPVIEPTDEDVREALEVLGMESGQCCCAYCGDRHTEWDHLRPIVKDRAPTGYITELANLVPSCGKCNQSKGNKPWKEWINSAARLSPKARGVPNLELRIERLEAYEMWREPVTLNYPEIVGATEWNRHMEHLDTVLEHLAVAENHARALRGAVERKMANS